mmetsp:Transcript_126153/g.392742  ORF Transcript_126153/g.392742 Transcript_126153/m.392742 type:complete len:386 (-) Transcript_126153:25-1182(-)
MGCLLGMPPFYLSRRVAVLTADALACEQLHLQAELKKDRVDNLETRRRCDAWWATVQSAFEDLQRRLLQYRRRVADVDKQPEEIADILEAMDTKYDDTVRERDELEARLVNLWCAHARREEALHMQLRALRDEIALACGAPLALSAAPAVTRAPAVDACVQWADRAREDSEGDTEGVEATVADDNVGADILHAALAMPPGGGGAGAVDHVTAKIQHEVADEAPFGFYGVVGAHRGETEVQHATLIMPSGGDGADTTDKGTVQHEVMDGAAPDSAHGARRSASSASSGGWAPAAASASSAGRSSPSPPASAHGVQQTTKTSSMATTSATSRSPSSSWPPRPASSASPCCRTTCSRRRARARRVGPSCRSPDASPGAGDEPGHGEMP